MNKTLKISEDVHQKLKVYCAQKGVKIQDWVQTCLVNGIEYERILKCARVLGDAKRKK